MPAKDLRTYRIGELATATGRSVHAIRWYEAQGLIPGVLRDGSGHRLYNARHLAWLELMDRLRRTGMSIAAMRHYTGLVMQGRSSLQLRRQLLVEHQAAVRQQIADWTQALQLIDRKVDFYGEWLATGARPVLEPHESPASAAKRAAPKKRQRAAPRALTAAADSRS